MNRPGLAESETLGARLRSLRTQAGLSGKELAEKAGWHPSKVSRLEHDGQTPAKDDLTTWGRICDLDEPAVHELYGRLQALLASKAQWLDRVRAGQVAIQAGYRHLLRLSSRIDYFETVFVPGMVQTPDYARRVLTEMRDIYGFADDVEATVAERAARQAYLYDTTKRFRFLLAEPVLLWRLAPPAVMRAQLDRLIGLIGLPNVEVGVLPLDRPLGTSPQARFTIYDEMAVTETFFEEARYTGERAELLRSIWDRHWSDAVHGEAARDLVAAAARRLPVE